MNLINVLKNARRSGGTGIQFAILWVCLFIIGSAEVIAGPMMTVMGSHFSVPSSRIALLPAAYGLVYAAVALAAGPLSDRFGRKYMLVAGLLGQAATLSVLPHCGSLTIAVWLSGLAGCSAAIIQPNALTMVADESPPDEIGRRIARVFVGLMTSFVVTPVLAGWMASEVGWQHAYHILGGTALLCAIGVVVRCPPGKQGRPTSFFSTHGAALQTVGVRTGLATSFLWLGCAAGFGAIVANVAARSLTLTTSGAGLIAAWFGLVVIAGNLCGHDLERRWPILALPALTVASATGIALFALPVDSPYLLALLGTPWAFGYGAAGPLHHARLNHLSERWRSTINSYHASLLNLGIFAVSGLYAIMTPHLSLGWFCVVIAGICISGTAFIPSTQRSLPAASPRNAP
ncbi:MULTISPECIES: MFS transporter [unclassified Sphingobium]|uniref:MFS transporter n=1 Tax=unclassified Sphingobium TaxID=2611147 RepID=UPI00214B443C|nr:MULTISPECIES: MFS transporter [unclassified Sphingobium]